MSELVMRFELLVELSFEMTYVKIKIWREFFFIINSRVTNYCHKCYISMEYSVSILGNFTIHYVGLQLKWSARKIASSSFHEFTFVCVITQRQLCWELQTLSSHTLYLFETWSWSYVARQNVAIFTCKKKLGTFGLDFNWNGIKIFSTVI